MTNARRPFRAAILLVGVLVSGPVAAQPRWPTTLDEARVEAGREQPASFVASEQVRLLGQALERYRDIEERGGWGKVPTDLAIGPGYSYDCRRIAAVEKRLVAEGYLHRMSTPPPAPIAAPAQRAQPLRGEPPMGRGGPCPYGPALTEAVRAFQADRKILGFGQVGKQTMVALNRPVHEIVKTIARDLERWRRVSLETSGNYLLVDIPFYELGVFENDRERMRIQVIVGQPTWQTPQFSDELEYIILNPDWGIPDKIAKQEYWPSAHRDRDYLRRQGITAIGGSLRQKPGPRNPLGRIKFVMPNKDDVYLHDTPEKRAFEAAVGALSHGCIRLSRPMDLANYLLRDDSQWNPRALETAIASGKTMQINLRRRMPVHILYSTSRVNEEGRLELRPDVYAKNRDAEYEEEQRAPRSDESLQAWP